MKVRSAANQITKLIAYLMCNQCDMKNKKNHHALLLLNVSYLQFTNRQEATTVTLSCLSLSHSVSIRFLWNLEFDHSVICYKGDLIF